MTLVLVLLGGAVGAPARYLADRYVQARHDSVFPWGTFTVNVAGSFILGALLSGVRAGVLWAGGPQWLLTVAGTGFCGALTTFSTFGYETIRLVEDGSLLAAVANVAASVVAGLAACGLGWWLVAALAR